MENFFLKHGELFANSIAKNLNWILPTAMVGIISCFGINACADHNAMEHGYERYTKFGNFETGVKKLHS